MFSSMPAISKALLIWFGLMYDFIFLHRRAILNWFSCNERSLLLTGIVRSIKLVIEHKKDGSMCNYYAKCYIS